MLFCTADKGKSAMHNETVQLNNYQYHCILVDCVEYSHAVDKVPDYGDEDRAAGAEREACITETEFFTAETQRNRENIIASR